MTADANENKLKTEYAHHEKGIQTTVTPFSSKIGYLKQYSKRIHGKIR